MVKAKRGVPYKYIVIVKDGLQVFLFGGDGAYELMCDCMGLDKKIVKTFLDRRGYYTGYDFTVFRTIEQTRERNIGVYIPD